MTNLFQTILMMSASGSLLALLVLSARGIFGRRQTVMLSVLFAMLIAKLIIPISIESPLSLQNIIAPETVIVFKQDDAPQTEATVAEVSEVTTNNEAQASNTTVIDTQNDTTIVQTAASGEPAANEVNLAQAAQSQAQQMPWQPSGMDIAAIVWLAGVAVLTIVFTWCNVRFMHKLKQNRVYTTQKFDAMLEECKDVLG